jgi:formate-nitrite transporter family protein
MTTPESGLTASVSERDHALGSPGASVMLVEYGDFECPYCAAATKAVAYLRRHLGDELRFVFRHFPVTELHPHAQQAALAAEAAAAQGSFWEMHDLLFERQEALEREDLERYAEEIDFNRIRYDGTDLRELVPAVERAARRS